MSNPLSVSEVARRAGVPPREISDLFYRRALRDDLCPIVGGRRLIPESYVPEITAALERRVTVESHPSADHDERNHVDGIA